MPYEQKDNSGSLFKNDRKERESQPGWKGSAVIGGVEYWISCWVNVASQQAKNPGQKYMSLRFDPKNQQGQVPLSEQGGDYDDDVPF